MATARLHLIDALAFEAVTGIATPPPADATSYTAYGLPWFELLEPTRRDLAASARLARVRSIADLEGRREAPLPIPTSRSSRCCACVPCRGEDAT